MPPSGAGPEGGERGRATCSKRPFLALEGEGCLQRDAASGSAAIGFLSRVQQSPQEDLGFTCVLSSLYITLKHRSKRPASRRLPD